MKLGRKRKGKAKPARGLREVLVEPPTTTRTWGTVVDGEHYGLDGQPPPATTAGWGDLSFLKR